MKVYVGCSTDPRTKDQVVGAYVPVYETSGINSCWYKAKLTKVKLSPTLTREGKAPRVPFTLMKKVLDRRKREE